MTGRERFANVRVDLVSPTGEGVDSWRCEEIFPQQMWSQARPPQPSDWAPQPSAEVFKGVVRASFIDADGKRWLRDSEGEDRPALLARQCPRWVTWGAGEPTLLLFDLRSVASGRPREPARTVGSDR